MSSVLDLQFLQKASAAGEFWGLRNYEKMVKDEVAVVWPALRISSRFFVTCCVPLIFSVFRFEFASLAANTRLSSVERRPKVDSFGIASDVFETNGKTTGTFSNLFVFRQKGYLVYWI